MFVHIRCLIHENMFDVVFASLDCLPAHGMENKIILGAVSSNPMTCH